MSRDLVQADSDARSDQEWRADQEAHVLSKAERWADFHGLLLCEFRMTQALWPDASDQIIWGTVGRTITDTMRWPTYGEQRSDTFIDAVRAFAAEEGYASVLRCLAQMMDAGVPHDD